MVLTPETKTFRDISQNLNEIPDLQSVESRAEEMADIALEIWPLITLIEEAFPNRINDEEE